MKARPKAAVDPTVLPFRPQSTGAARFAKFCERFVKVPNGTGGTAPLRTGDRVGNHRAAVQIRPRTGSQNNHRLTTVAARRGPEIVTRLRQLTAFDLGTSARPTFPACGTVTSTTFLGTGTLPRPTAPTRRRRSGSPQLTGPGRA